MTVRGALHIDLQHQLVVTADEDYLDKRALSALDRAPAGVRVVIDVRGRNYVTISFADWTHRHVDRLHIEVWGDSPELVAQFVNAVRTGDPNNRGVAA